MKRERLLRWVVLLRGRQGSSDGDESDYYYIPLQYTAHSRSQAMDI